MRMWGLLLVASVVIGLSPVALAGIEDGDVRVGAGIAAVAYSEDELEGLGTDVTAVTISSGALLQIGIVPSELTEIGVKLGLWFRETEVDALGIDSKSTTVRVVPYGALNFAVGDSVYLSPTVGMGYSGLFSDTIDIDSFMLDAGLEAKIFVAKDASIDVGFFVTYETGKADVEGFFADYKNLDYDNITIGPRIKISIWP